MGTFQDRFLNSGRVEHINSLISSLCLSFDKPFPFLHLLLPIPSYPPHYKYQNIRRIAGQTGYQDRHDIRIAGTVQLKSFPVLFFFMWGQEAPKNMLIFGEMDTMIELSTKKYYTKTSFTSLGVCDNQYFAT